MLVVNGWKVGALRLGMNLSQEALAAKAGISHGQIPRIESGKTKNVGIVTVGKLVEALGVTVEDILGTEGEEG